MVRVNENYVSRFNFWRFREEEEKRMAESSKLTLGIPSLNELSFS